MLVRGSSKMNAVCQCRLPAAEKMTGVFHLERHRDWLIVNMEPLHGRSSMKEKAMDGPETVCEVQAARHTIPGRQVPRLTRVFLALTIAALVVYTSAYALGTYQDVQTSIAKIRTVLEIG
jgi:hypothetical protein